jgi:heme-degrading monooxygenase HmoA
MARRSAVIVTVFRSRLKEAGQDEYLELAPKISALAQSMPGYRSHKVFVAEDGERVTLVEFADEGSQRSWSSQADHVAAKKRGREAFYSEYSIQVCQVLRESHFRAPGTED